MTKLDSISLSTVHGGAQCTLGYRISEAAGPAIGAGMLGAGTGAAIGGAIALGPQGAIPGAVIGGLAGAAIAGTEAFLKAPACRTPR